MTPVLRGRAVDPYTLPGPSIPVARPLYVVPRQERCHLTIGVGRMGSRQRPR